MLDVLAGCFEGGGGLFDQMDRFCGKGHGSGVRLLLLLSLLLVRDSALEYGKRGRVEIILYGRCCVLALRR